MEEQASQVTIDFAKQLIELSRVIVDIFKTSDLDKLPSMNRIIKEPFAARQRGCCHADHRRGGERHLFEF